MGSVRVVITALGAATPLALDVPGSWEGLCAGRGGIQTIKAFDPVGFPCKLAGEVPAYSIRDFVPKSHRKGTKLMSRDIELAVIAAREAFVAAGLVTRGIDPDAVNVEPERMAINLGAGLISCDLVELAPAVAASVTDGRFDIHKWGTVGLDLVTPLWLLKYLPNMLACHVGIIHDIQGPSNTITCAEASAHIAIAEAAEIIARGDADIALAGGAEAKVNPIVMARQCLTRRATTEGNKAPESACRPFDAGATGSVFGEAAGVVILENLEHAERRGARIYAELVGTGQSTNINPAYETLEPDALGVRMAIEQAMGQAQISPDELDLIIPHGTGIPGDDAAEARAISAALGPDIQAPVWPTKSLLSNTGAAAGALDVIAAACAMRDALIPAAVNFEKPAPGCNLNITRQPRHTQIRYALCCSYTYGGQTTALVLKNLNADKVD
jgi:3-oxoacyl-[acyl-carrier-protein] synthase II